MKVGLCGLGPMGRTHGQLLKQHGGDVEFIAVADVQKDVCEKFAQENQIPQTFESGEAMIDSGELDVVFICAPTYLHSPLAVRALKAGLHVFSEKPMSLDKEGCDAMIAAAEKSGKMLIIGQVLRFWPEYVYLKEMIDSNQLGPLQSLSLRRLGGVTIGFERWFLDEKRGGMQIFDRHIHDTDLVLWLLGRPQAVKSHGFELCPETDGGIVHNFTEYVFDDMAVNAEGSADMPDGYPFLMSYTAVFEKGCIEFSNQASPTLSVYTKGKVEHPELPAPLGELQTGLNITSAGGYYLEQVYFFDCILNGRKPTIVTPENARETIEVVRAEIKSVRSGKQVDL